MEYVTTRKYSVGSVLRLHHAEQRDKPVNPESGGVDQLAVMRRTRWMSPRTVAPAGGGGASTVVNRCVATPSSLGRSRAGALKEVTKRQPVKTL
jgi:hypothetical protein